MKPTLRAAYLLIFGVPLSLVLILLDENLWSFGFLYLGLALLLIGFDALNSASARALAVEPHYPEALYSGGQWQEEDRARFILRNGSGRGVYALEALLDVEEENLARLGGQTLPLIPSEQSAEVAFDLRPKRRGTATLNRLWLRWRSPLGLMERRKTLDLGREIPILPNVRAVRHAALKLDTRDAFFGTKVQKQQGDGTEFEALREYVPGLDLRSIDWKHSARHLKLVCKEFQVERNHNVVLAFDCGHLMTRPLEGSPQLDHMVNAGLLLGFMALRGGDRVGVLGFDSGVRLYAEPLGGAQAFQHIQRSCASLDYQHDETNFTLGLAHLLDRLQRRSLIVIYTDFVDTVTAELMVENIARLAKRHLVLFVTLQDRALVEVAEQEPASVHAMAQAVVADDFLRERRVVFERLRRLGVHILEASAASVSAGLVERYLEIKRQELI